MPHCRGIVTPLFIIFCLRSTQGSFLYRVGFTDRCSFFYSNHSIFVINVNEKGVDRTNGQTMPQNSQNKINNFCFFIITSTVCGSCSLHPHSLSPSYVQHESNILARPGPTILPSVRLSSSLPFYLPSFPTYPLSRYQLSRLSHSSQNFNLKQNLLSIFRTSKTRTVAKPNMHRMWAKIQAKEMSLFLLPKSKLW